MDRPATRLQWYVVAVSAVGFVFLAALAGRGGLHPAVDNPTRFVLFGILLLAGEVFPISVPTRQGGVDEVTISTMFAFAILLGYGTVAAVVAQVLVSVIADAIYRKQIWKIAFNAAQYTIALGVAGLVYEAAGGVVGFTASSLGPFALAAITFYVLNTVVTDVAIALQSDIALLPYLGGDLVFQAYVGPPLLALSPVVVVAAERSQWLLPLLIVPAFAVYRGTRLAVENIKLVSQLQQNLDRMTELNRMKDDFVAVVSHELRTPLTSIQGYIKTLLQLSPELAEQQRRSFLEAADRQSDRLRRLIEQLLVVARLESHIEPLVVGEVVLSRVAAHVVDELRPRSHGHTFDVRIPAALDEVRTDEAKLHQIISNLVENALKYSPPDTRVIIKAEPSVQGVVLIVEDEGGGIPIAAQDRIFERFYQVDSSATRQVGGTGLGLYICRKMAEAIGARLWLGRSDPVGSEFCLFIPAEPPQDEALGGDEPTGDSMRAATPVPQSITASV